MKTLINRLKPTFVAQAVVFCLVFTLANTPIIAHAQVKRVLIVEHTEKEKKPKILWEGDKITLHSAQTGKQHKGRITAFSDSSLTLGQTEFPLQEITYIQGKGKVSDANKVIGFALIPVALILSTIALVAHDLDGFDSSLPFLVLGPGSGVLSVYLLTNKSAQPFGPETGWRLRIKRIEPAE